MYTISKISKTCISISCNALQVDPDDKGSVTRDQMSLVLQILGVLLHQQSRMDKTHQIKSALCMKKAKRACLPQCCSTCVSESSVIEDFISLDIHTKTLCNFLSAPTKPVERLMVTFRMTCCPDLRLCPSCLASFSVIVQFNNYARFHFWKPQLLIICFAQGRMLIEDGD